MTLESKRMGSQRHMCLLGHARQEARHCLYTAFPGNLCKYQSHVAQNNHSCVIRLTALIAFILIPMGLLQCKMCVSPRSAAGVFFFCRSHIFSSIKQNGIRLTWMLFLAIYVSSFALEQGNPLSKNLHSPHCANGWCHQVPKAMLLHSGEVVVSCWYQFSVVLISSALHQYVKFPSVFKIFCKLGKIIHIRTVFLGSVTYSSGWFFL